MSNTLRDMTKDSHYPYYKLEELYPDLPEPTIVKIMELATKKPSLALLMREMWKLIVDHEHWLWENKFRSRLVNHLTHEMCDIPEGYNSDDTLPGDHCAYNPRHKVRDYEKSNYIDNDLYQLDDDYRAKVLPVVGAQYTRAVSAYARDPCVIDRLISFYEKEDMGFNVIDVYAVFILRMVDYALGLCLGVYPVMEGMNVKKMCEDYTLPNHPVGVLAMNGVLFFKENDVRNPWIDLVLDAWYYDYAGIGAAKGIIPEAKAIEVFDWSMRMVNGESECTSSSSSLDVPVVEEVKEVKEKKRKMVKAKRPAKKSVTFTTPVSSITPTAPIMEEKKKEIDMIDLSLDDDEVIKNGQSASKKICA